MAREDIAVKARRLAAQADERLHSEPGGDFVLLLGGVLERCADEVDYLRALPVIARCSTCCKCGANAGGDSNRCYHPKAPPPAVICEESAPPSWCPLRGAP